MKQKFFNFIRNAHKVFALKELPPHLGLYFHELEPHQWDDFERVITYFTNRGYQTVSSQEYSKAAQNQKCLFISFDDNYKSWHTALPLFERCGITVTFYVNSLPIRDKVSDQVISDYFDRIDHQGERISLSAAEIKELSDHGHEIGCHTHSHFQLNTLPENQWDTEILESKQQLEAIIGKEVTSFSYPFGMRRYFSKNLRTYCLQNGFDSIAAAIPGLQYGQSDSHVIHRTRIHLHNSIEESLTDLCIDGRFFESITGKSAIG